MKPSATVHDFRSDSVTRPTAAMRAVMASAELGDDGFSDDPGVNALQEKVAAMLGFEAALFMPSGTQSNLCAILSHCQRGDEYIVGHNAHCYCWEGGGAAVFGSVQPQPLQQAADGTLSLQAIEAAIKPDDPHFARTRLLALENTWTGQVLPFEYVQAATALAHAAGLQCHLDGARLFNAAVYQAGLQGKDSYDDICSAARAITACFDSVSVCFSKGLGAPIGSALCGSRAFIARAYRIRKMAGGGMRQVGALAAAASYALDHHVQRLTQDHALARTIADGLRGLEGIALQEPQTNMVWLELQGPEASQRCASLVKQLAAQGLLTDAQGRLLRLVTHLDVDAVGAERLVAALRQLLSTGGLSLHQPVQNR